MKKSVSINLFNLNYNLVALGTVTFVLITGYLFNYILNITDLTYDQNLIFITSVLSILLYSFLFIPGAIVSLKKGWESLLAILILEFLWVVLVLAIYTVYSLTYQAILI
jgi:hypothetical protein